VKNFEIMITDSEVFVILFIALIVGVLASRLGVELYR
jgi:photosystem I reaction center subunit XII